MDKLKCFSLTKNEHVARLVLNKPESLNTMHPTFWRELDTVLRQLNNEGPARAL
jgi:enoyl-CoA hydratase